MRTPYDHQSAAVPCPFRFTTSGAMYSTVPQNENVFLASNIDSLLRPKSVSLIFSFYKTKSSIYEFSPSQLKHLALMAMSMTVVPGSSVRRVCGDDLNSCKSSCASSKNKSSVELPNKMAVLLLADVSPDSAGWKQDDFLENKSIKPTAFCIHRLSLPFSNRSQIFSSPEEKYFLQTYMFSEFCYVYISRSVEGRRANTCEVLLH